MEHFEIVYSGTRAEVYAPFHPEFVAALKRAGGRWDSQKRTWVVSAAAVDTIRARMRAIDGRDDTEEPKRVDVRLTFTSSLYESCGPIFLLGKEVAKATGRDSGARIGPDACFACGTPTSGGSAKNWYTCIQEGSVCILAGVPESMAVKDNLPEGVELEIIQSSSVDREALEAERKKLLDRLAEIDAILGREAVKN